MLMKNDCLPNITDSLCIGRKVVKNRILDFYTLSKTIQTKGKFNLYFGSVQVFTYSKTTIGIFFLHFCRNPQKKPSSRELPDFAFRNKNALTDLQFSFQITNSEPMLSTLISILFCGYASKFGTPAYHGCKQTCRFRESRMIYLNHSKRNSYPNAFCK